MQEDTKTKHRIYSTSVASVYPHYVRKVEKKGHTKKEVDEVITWLTGYSQKELQAQLKNGAHCSKAAMYLRNSSKSLVFSPAASCEVLGVVEEDRLRDLLCKSSSRESREAFDHGCDLRRESGRHQRPDDAINSLFG